MSSQIANLRFAFAPILLWVSALLLTACNPLANSTKIDSNFNPGGVTSVTASSTAVNVVTIISPTNNSYINSATDSAVFAISGTCSESASVITLKVDATTVASPVCTAGVWTATMNSTTVSAGAHVFSANSPTVSASVNFTRDVTAPAAATALGWAQTSPANATTSSWTKSAAADLANQKIQYYADGTCTSASGGLIDLTSSLLQSNSFTGSDATTYTYKITSIDTAGNSSVSACSSAMLVDKTNPAVALTSFNSGGIFKGGTSYNITWTATDANIAVNPVSLSYSTNSGSTWTSIATSITNSGTYSWTTPAIDSPNVRVKVTAVDSAANSGVASSSSDFIIDSTAPVLATFQLASGATNVAMPTVPVSVTATDNNGMGSAQMQFSESAVFTGATWVAYAATGATFSVTATNGSKTVYARVKDAVGNISNTLTYTLQLDFGTPPVVSISSPVAGSTYSAGNTVPIAWSCSSVNGLAASPIESIKYTVDDGATFVTPDIANNLTNNLTATTGNYNWTLPGGVTTFRLLVSCKSAAGVVASAYSQPINTGGWSIFMGDASYRKANLNAIIADVRGTSVWGDINNNIYFVKSNAIRKIDAATGLVTNFAGVETVGGCTFVAGVNPTGAGIYLSTPNIIGTPDSNLDSILVQSCGSIYKLTTAGVVSLWATVPGFQPMVPTSFLTKNKILLYTGSDNRVYKVDLSTSGNTATAIYGNGACSHSVTRYVNGTDIFGQELFQSSGTQPCTEATIVANADASSIWYNMYNSGNGMRYDYNSGTGHYVVGVSDVGVVSSNYRNCIAPEYGSNNIIYCSWRMQGPAGRQIHKFDTSTGTWTGSIDTLPFVNNDNSGDFYLGSLKDKLLGIYSLNSISTIDTTSGPPFTYVNVGGTAYSIMGNGTDPTQVEFDVPTDIKYVSSAQTLYVRNETGHVRKIDFSTNPYTTSTIFYAFPGWSSSGFGYFMPNLAGNKFSIRHACARNNQGNYSLISGVFGTLTNFDDGPCDTTTGLVYPPASGINPNTANPIFTFANRPFVSTGAYHTNGNYYFGAKNGTNDIFVFSSNGTVMNRVAGKVGVGGYNAGDNGNVALGASLTSVLNVQEIASGANAGDLLIWDGDRLRMITITTHSASPTIVDLYSFTLAAGYTAGTIPNDFYYDQGSEQGGVVGTGTIYYVTAANAIHKIVPNAAMTAATDSTYSFTGTTVGAVARIALTPAGLLILQKSQRRILRVAP